MLSQNIMTLIYVIAGVVVFAALVRIALRRRQRAQDRSTEALPSASNEPEPQAPATAAGSLSDQVVDQVEQAELNGEALRPPQDPSYDLDIPSHIAPDLLASTADSGEQSGSAASVADRADELSADPQRDTAKPRYESDIFAPMRPAPDRAAGVPVVGPGDVPFADQSDLVFGPLTPTLAAMLPESEERRRAGRKEVMAAGFYNPHAHVNFSAIRYLGIMVPMFLMGLMLVLSPSRLEWMALIGLVVLPLVGWSLPRIYVQGRIEQRKREVEQGIPDMLDMLNMCVSQGLTVQESLIRVGDELVTVYPALAQELRIVGEQARVGTMSQALDSLKNRVDVNELNAFSALLIQTERMGTSISHALADYSTNLRTTLQQRADERGNRAAFQLLFPSVLCLMPAVYLILLGPSVMAISDFMNGDGPGSRQQIQQTFELMNSRQ